MTLAIPFFLVQAISKKAPATHSSNKSTILKDVGVIPAARGAATVGRPKWREERK
jgi:hypothetical protein